MKKSAIIVVGLCVAVAALVLLGRMSHDEPPSDPRPSREPGATAGNYGAGERRGGGQTRGSSPGERPRGGSSGAGVDQRRAGGDRVDGWPVRQRGGTDAAARNSGAGARLPERDARIADVPRSQPELPADSGRDTHQQGDGTDTADEQPIPDVAYDAGEKVFDTTSKVAIADAAIATPDGSIAFWVEPQWGEDNQDGATFVQLGEDGIRLVKKGNTLSFEYTDAS